MQSQETIIAKKVASAASVLQRQRTGHAPQAVTVVFSDDTLVITLHEALTPAERMLASSAEGAGQVQEFHRQLFADSVQELNRQIEKITGRRVREAATELEIASGIVFHAFTTGAMVQVFLLAPTAVPCTSTDGGTVERADYDGLRAAPETHPSD